MTNVKPNRIVRRGRLFPEIQWSEEKKAQRLAEAEAIYQRCKVVFDRLQPQLIQTHYKWYIAVEPDSGDYFIDEDDMMAGNMCRQKYPNAIPFVFRINETGVCGTI
ncbi:hypothetical protein PN499_09335 [Kamptonema animale CS-326]|jgi:hypothetical protein|uniref:hypothetical protein n=1 Tax=Kamptonema animale TaxID=92934 RepID=UPI00232B811C|nr:hypothetical protein [Kamptonema animale]MDB9511382.1 hypothetical protein [Kamptonema animale CS-326]